MLVKETSERNTQDSHGEALKYVMILQWYFETKIQNLYDNSKRHKTENHTIQQVPYDLLIHLTATFVRF